MFTFSQRKNTLVNAIFAYEKILTSYHCVLLLMQIMILDSRKEPEASNQIIIYKVFLFSRYVICQFTSYKSNHYYFPLFLNFWGKLNCLKKGNTNCFIFLSSQKYDFFGQLLIFRVLGKQIGKIHETIFSRQKRFPFWTDSKAKYYNH